MRLPCSAKATSDPGTFSWHDPIYKFNLLKSNADSSITTAEEANKAFELLLNVKYDIQVMFALFDEKNTGAWGQAGKFDVGTESVQGMIYWALKNGKCCT